MYYVYYKGFFPYFEHNYGYTIQGTKAAISSATGPPSIPTSARLFDRFCKYYTVPTPNKFSSRPEVGPSEINSLESLVILTSQI